MKGKIESGQLCTVAPVRLEELRAGDICNDEGSEQCASCEEALTQADCDALAEAAGCDSATTSDFTACGEATTGCNFLGCDFRPDCE